MENKSKNRKVWSDGETNIFIDIWGENIEKLRKAKRNGHIMAEMTQKLAQHNINVNATEVLNKINNLTKRYRQEKKQCGVSGGSPSEWPLYLKIHEIIGAFKSNQYDLSEETFSGSNISESNDSVFSDVSDTSVACSTSSTSAFGTATTSSASWPPAPSLRARKRKHTDDYDEIKKLMEKSSQTVAEELKRSNDLLAEANKIESDKLKLVDSFVNTNIEFQKTLLELLSKKGD